VLVPPSAYSWRYFASFPRACFHVVLFDDLKRDFTATVRGLPEFLDLDTTVEIRPARHNPASRLRAPKLNAWLRSRSGVGRIARRLLSERMLSYVHKGLRRPFLASFSYPPTDPRTESDLRWRYLPDVRKLEAMLGRDLSRWYPEGAGSAADTPP